VELPRAIGHDSAGRRQPRRLQRRATDGGIGKVDEATNEVGSSYIVVDTGPWIFGKKVLLPAGTIDRVDSDSGKLYVDLTKDQIKDSPEFDQSSYNEPAYRNRVGDYYGRYYNRQ
jgi:hypothetical protein